MLYNKDPLDNFARIFIASVIKFQNESLESENFNKSKLMDWQRKLFWTMIWNSALDMMKTEIEIMV